MSESIDRIFEKAETVVLTNIMNGASIVAKDFIRWFNRKALRNPKWQLKQKGKELRETTWDLQDKIK